MKSVFVAGSMKFFDEIEEFAKKFIQNRLQVSTPKKDIILTDFEGDEFEGQKAALFRSFELINKADILYVFAKSGYVGKTVSMEIAYAFSLGKKIISSEKIEEPSARVLVSEVLNPEELIEKCRHT